MGKNSNKKGSSWVTPVFNFNQSEKELQSSLKPCNSASNLWVDEFPPSSKEELAIHKKKIAEVEWWIQENLRGTKGKQILLLTGPPGTGKSATIRALALELKILLKEWRNPPVIKYEEMNSFETYSSPTTKFSDFLLRGSKYDTVCHIKGQYLANRKRSLIIVEELPNAFIFDPMKFHPILRKFSFMSTCGIVFILSESSSDEKLTRNLFPAEFQQELNVTSIAYNPVAQSLQMQALNRIISSVSKSEGISQALMPTKDTLNAIIEGASGDLRSAINSLQFSLRGASIERTKSESFISKKRRRRGSSATPSASLNPSPLTIGSKDSSLILFRSLGKILYCKRVGDCVLENLPSNLKPMERLPLHENPEDIFDKTSSDASTLSLFLHHNCPHFFQDIDAFSKALHCVGDADILGTYWTGSDCLETYSSSICIRGLMFHLDSRSSKNTFRPLTRPKWFSSNKLTRERMNKLKFFHRDFTVTDHEIAANVVPYLAKIGNFVSPEARILCQEVGVLSTSGRTSLDDSDADIKDCNCSIEDVPLSTPGFGEHLSSTSIIAENNAMDVQEDDEDFLIEEYED